MVNGYPNKFIGDRFKEWYLTQISKHFENIKALEEVDAKIALSVLKPLCGQLLVKLYNETTEGRKIILS